MDELVARIMARAEIDAEKASTALIIILKFLRDECAPDVFERVLDVMPGAREALPAAEPKGAIGSMLGMLGGTGGMITTISALTGAGLGMSQIQDTTKEIMKFAREKGGSALLDEVVGSIPQLQMFAS
jgi:hypothetical protein